MTAGAAGEWVTLTLMAHAGAQEFVALDADIRFPPGLLQVIGPDGKPATAILPLPALSTLMRNDADNAAGRILYGAGLPNGVASGDVAVALLRFPLAPGGSAAVVHLHDASVAAADGRDVTGTLTDARAISRGGLRYFPLVFGGQAGDGQAH